MPHTLRILRSPWLVAALILQACHTAATLPPPAAAPQPPAAAPPANTEPYTAEAEAAAATISGEYLRERVAALSSDDFKGRGPASDGDRAARAYLVEQLKGLGLTPGLNGQWEQPFDLIGVESELPKQWVFKRGGKQLPIHWWDQYIAGSAVQADHGAVENAEIVFVGYGIQAPEFQWDDFKGQDLKGKVLLVLNNDPDWDPALFAGNTRLYYGRWTYKYESAARQGAVGAIVIHTTPSAGYPFSVVQSSWTGKQFELPRSDTGNFQLKAWLTQDAARSVAKFAGKDLDQLVESAKSREFKPMPLGITTSIAFKNKIEKVRTANVLGTLEGSDPEAKSEYVVYTAHHDHLGVGKADAKGDTIYNGALDNATGVAQVLSIAKAFKALPQAPRRSTMFLFVAAEEQGLLGSKYFVENSPIPHGKIAANVNYDGGNIWGRTRDVTYIGKGKSSLDAIADGIAARQGRVVKPDQFPDRGHLYRSDQLSFIKAGVPALALDTGTEFIGKEADWGKKQVEEYEEHHYHQPSDELRPEWVFDGMVEDAQLGFWTGYLVGNAKTLPSWVPGDEFEAARKAALAAPATQ